MQYYSAKIRLSGSPLNEIRDVYSAPEILILQYVHGVDSITDIKRVKTEKENLMGHKQMLKGKYDSALVKRKQSVDSIFGPLGQVPTQLPENLMEQYDIIDENDVVAVAKSVTRSDKKHQMAAHPQTPMEVMNLEKLVPSNEVDMSSILE